MVYTENSIYGLVRTRVYYIMNIGPPLCVLVVEFLAADPEVPGLIPGATRFSEK
jgi:hypothetical protein